MYTNDKTLLDLVKRFAPEGFAKKSVEVTPCEVFTPSNMNWSGGTKNYYTAVALATGEIHQLEEPPFQLGGSRPPIKMTAGVAVICYKYRGMSKLVEVLLHPSNLTQETIPGDALTEDQLALLYCTRCLKNSYGGETDLRRKEANRYGYNFTPQVWAEEQRKLSELGYLDRRGSLTVKGKNAAPNALAYKR